MFTFKEKHMRRLAILSSIVIMLVLTVSSSTISMENTSKKREITTYCFDPIQSFNYPRTIRRNKKRRDDLKRD